MRVATACANCRKRRRRCELPRHGGRCLHCRDNNIPCHLPTSRRRESIENWSLSGDDHRSVSSAAATPSAHPPRRNTVSFSPEVKGNNTNSDHPGSVPLPERAVQLELVDLYFAYINDQFHSLFHPPSFRADVEQGKAPPVIVYAMIALSARFSTHPMFADVDPKARGAPYAEQCQRLLDLRDIALTTLQAAVLLGAYWTCEGYPASESIYVCIACRLAQLLDLPSRPTFSLLERELNRRVWWTLCMIDVWSSAGVDLPTQLPRQLSVPLPIDDLVFLNLTPFDMAEDLARISPLPTPASSLIAQMVKLNRILAEIHELNQQAVTGRLDGIMLEDAVDTVARKLEFWLEALPDGLRDRPENLSRYAALGLGRVFVAVYCGYYHYGQLLYYQFLHEESYGSVPSAHAYSNRCKAHAAALCEIIYASHATPDCDVLYNMIGHVLVVASTVQIHTLVFSPHDDDIKVARSRLERNFQVLLHLQKFWTTLEVCVLRLRVFHASCCRSITTSFMMDRWMLRFLCEFGRPVDDREGNPGPDASWTLEGIGINP